MATTWSASQKAGFVAFALACAGLAFLAYHELTSSSFVPTVSGETSQIAQIHHTNEPMIGRDPMPPLKSFAEVMERPLFSPGRRPPHEAVKSTGKPWSALVLKGIVVTGEVREALVAPRASPSAVPLRKGQTIDGWTIRKIGTDRVVIENDGERHELRLPGTGSGGALTGPRAHDAQKAP